MPRPPSARDLADPASPAYVVEESPFFLLNRATATYAMQMSRAMRRVGADIPSWRVLVLAEQRGPISVSALADLAVIRLSTVTKVVQRLARAGLIRVRRSRKDRRVTEVLISARGRAAARAVREAASGIFRRAFAGTGDAELRELNRLLRRLVDNMETGPHG